MKFTPRVVLTLGAMVSIAGGCSEPKRDCGRKRAQLPWPVGLKPVLYPGTTLRSRGSRRSFPFPLRGFVAAQQSQSSPASRASRLLSVMPCAVVTPSCSE